MLPGVKCLIIVCNAVVRERERGRFLRAWGYAGVPDGEREKRREKGTWGAWIWP